MAFEVIIINEFDGGQFEFEHDIINQEIKIHASIEGDLYFYCSRFDQIEKRLIVKDCRNRKSIPINDANVPYQN